jgi:hypothetical protein
MTRPNLLDGCDPEIIAAVEALNDAELTRIGMRLSGLAIKPFAEEVMIVGYWMCWYVLHGKRRWSMRHRKFLQREVIRAKQRAKDGVLPDTVYCGACGRGGKGPMIVTLYDYTRKP